MSIEEASKSDINLSDIILVYLSQSYFTDLDQLKDDFYTSSWIDVKEGQIEGEIDHLVEEGEVLKVTIGMDPAEGEAVETDQVTLLKLKQEGEGIV